MKSSFKKALPVAFALAALPFSARAEQDIEYAVCIHGIAPDAIGLKINYNKNIELGRSFKDFAVTYKIQADEFVSKIQVDDTSHGITSRFGNRSEIFNIEDGTLSFGLFLDTPNQVTDGIEVTRTILQNYYVGYDRLIEADRKLMDGFLDCAAKTGYSDVFKRPALKKPGPPPSPAQPK